MNNLKLELLEKGKSQRWLAKETGIPESYISMSIRGRYILSRSQKKMISQVLNCEKKEVCTCEI